LSEVFAVVAIALESFQTRNGSAGLGAFGRKSLLRWRHLRVSDFSGGPALTGGRDVLDIAQDTHEARSLPPRGTIARNSRDSSKPLAQSRVVTLVPENVAR